MGRWIHTSDSYFFSNGIEEEELLQIIKCVYLMENKNEDTQVAEIRAHDIYQRIIGSVTKDEDK